MENVPKKDEQLDQIQVFRKGIIFQIITSTADNKDILLNTTVSWESKVTQEPYFNQSTSHTA